MSIMVTGGSGFIGPRIISKLIGLGEKVLCFDLHELSCITQPGQELVHFYKGDVTRLSDLLEAVKTYEINRIVHLAALLPPTSEDRPHLGMTVNIQGTNNVFETARLVGIKRVVYASSIAAYGDQIMGHSFTEDDPVKPINNYGMTKASNDFAASIYMRRYDLDLRGIRISTVFGHGRTTGMTGMIGGLLISLPAIGEPVSLPFSPDESSSMIHAEDAAEIFVRAILARDLKHPIYNSGGAVASIGEISQIVQEFLPDSRITTGGQSVPHVYCVDNTRMLRDIGYELPPLRLRVLDHINAARHQVGLATLSS